MKCSEVGRDQVAKLAMLHGKDSVYGEANSKMTLTKAVNKCILTLTRCCTQNCDFCAVDAIVPLSVINCLRDCAANAAKEQEIGNELTHDQWTKVIKNLLLIDNKMEFDLSGGDCLALPWVRNEFIPFLLETVGDNKRVSITATAVSLRAWLDEIHKIDNPIFPGNVHITYDGYRPYSFDNLALVKPLRDLGVDVHAECPLTVENCSQTMVNRIYKVMLDYQISEILLMRFFPVGRGVKSGESNPWEPTALQYRNAIAEFQRISKLYNNGPKIKLQCALKEYIPESRGYVLCKMGNSTWCVMPNGDVLICPWAYGMNGNALDQSFVAGNALDSPEFIVKQSSLLIKAQYKEAPGKCKVLEFGKNKINAFEHDRQDDRLSCRGGEA